MSESSSHADARTVLWRGHVQGVGFRAVVVAAARTWSIVGWVRNRADGSVEALLIGTTAAVEAALRDVQRARTPYIQSVQTFPAATPEQLPTTFEINR